MLPLEKPVSFDYTNHHGRQANRRVLPLTLGVAPAEARYYPGQYILKAYDLDKGAKRSFAMTKITDWKE